MLEEDGTEGIKEKNLPYGCPTEAIIQKSFLAKAQLTQVQRHIIT